MTAVQARATTSPQLDAAVERARADIARVDAPAPAPTPTFEPSADPPAPAPGGYLFIPAQGPPPTIEEIERNRKLAERSRRADGLLAVGGSLPVAGLICGITGAVLWSDSRYTHRGRSAGIGLVAGGATAIVAGGVLLAIGLGLQAKRRKDSQR